MNKSLVATIVLVVTWFHAPIAAAEDAAAPVTDQTFIENGAEYQLKPLPAPFELTGEEQAEVTKVLEQWEHHSATFENYSCKYTCWVYDEIWPRKETCDGEFRIDKEGRYSISDNGIRSPDNEKKLPQLKRWVFDGKTLINYEESKKKVSRTPIPQDPKRVIHIPFVLKANAKELAEQYYIRVVKHEKDRHQILLQFYPRTKAVTGWFEGIRLNQFSSRSDWRRYDHVDLILSAETYIPVAMQLHDSRYSRVSYLAHSPIVNAEDTSDWFQIETPQGWQEIELPIFAKEERPAEE